MPSWIELASAAAVLLLILLIVLIILSLRAANRRRARRQAGMYGIAETHDVFIADKTRITYRPAPVPEPTPDMPEPPEPPDGPVQ